MVLSKIKVILGFVSKAYCIGFFSSITILVITKKALRISC
ncbi:hypothetical protein FEM08_24780 [Flavobacterium gilvum]|nr:hypothetical protein FEM08_24780 [Flavobacterium gilvum]